MAIDANSTRTPLLRRPGDPGAVPTPIPAAAPGLPSTRPIPPAKVSKPALTRVQSPAAKVAQVAPPSAKPAQVAPVSLPPAAVRQVVRLCADCAAGIRERADMADRYATAEASALRSLAVAIDHVVADWAASHGGAR